MTDPRPFVLLHIDRESRVATLCVGDTLAKARHLVRQAKKRVHRPPKHERPRCGKATPRGPCQAAAWWPADAVGPRKRCRMHSRK